MEFPSADEHPLFYVGVYAAIGIGSVLLDMIANAALIFGAYRASRLLFKRLLDNVIHATMRWHDTTPTGELKSRMTSAALKFCLGRILNRFSKDFETIDTSIGQSFYVTLSCLVSVFLSAVTIIAIAPVFFFPAVFITYLV